MINTTQDIKNYFNTTLSIFIATIIFCCGGDGIEKCMKDSGNFQSNFSYLVAEIAKEENLETIIIEYIEEQEYDLDSIIDDLNEGKSNIAEFLNEHSNSLCYSTAKDIIIQALYQCRLLDENDIDTQKESANHPDQKIIWDRIGNKTKGLLSIDKVYEDSKKIKQLNPTAIEKTKIGTPKFISILIGLTKNLFNTITVDIKKQKLKKYYNILQRHSSLKIGLFKNENNKPNLDTPLSLNQLIRHI